MSHPPSSTWPSSGWSNAYQSTNASGHVVVPLDQREVVLDGMLPDPVRQVESFNPAWRCGLQNSVVHENTPRWSYIQSCAPPLIVCFGSYLKSWNTETAG